MAGTVTRCGWSSGFAEADPEWYVYFKADHSGEVNSLPASMMMQEAEYQLLQATKGI